MDCKNIMKVVRISVVILSAAIKAYYLWKNGQDQNGHMGSSRRY